MTHDAIIIGAGIAGASLAHELRQRGENILVMEAAPAIGNGASGNPKGMIKPWLALGDSEMRKFYTAAYHHCLTLLEQYPEAILQRGILQLPKDDNEARFADAPRLSGFDEKDLRYLTAGEASNLMQTDIRSDALFWPRAAVIDPVAWTRALLGDTPIKFKAEIKSLAEIDARRIYITTGHAMHLLPGISARIRPRMGQISMTAAQNLPQLPHAISFGHYMIPSTHAEDHMIGATYEHADDVQITDAGHQKNLDALKKLTDTIPALVSAKNLTPADCIGRSAVRATTANHMPLFGQVHENIFYLTGLGSRGLMSAPYAARLLIQAKPEN